MDFALQLVQTEIRLRRNYRKGDSSPGGQQRSINIAHVQIKINLRILLDIMRSASWGAIVNTPAYFEGVKHDERKEEGR
jgi:hypothetical protein